jgi:hypothetical protein
MQSKNLFPTEYFSQVIGVALAACQAPYPPQGGTDTMGPGMSDSHANFDPKAVASQLDGGRVGCAAGLSHDKLRLHDYLLAVARFFLTLD